MHLISARRRIAAAALVTAGIAWQQPRRPHLVAYCRFREAEALLERRVSSKC